MSFSEWMSMVMSLEVVGELRVAEVVLGALVIGMVAAIGRSARVK